MVTTIDRKFSEKDSIFSVNTRLNSLITWAQEVLVEAMLSYDRDSHTYWFVEVNWMSWENPIFKLNQSDKKLTRASKKEIDKLRASLDKTFYIPINHNSFRKLMVESDEKDFEKKLAWFGEILAWKIMLWEIPDYQIEYYKQFDHIRRALQKSECISEYDSAIYIYQSIIPYIWIATFLSLQKKLWRNPTHTEFFMNIPEYIFDHLNALFNDLWAPSNHTLFFILRDAFLTWCSNSLLDWLVYPFSDKD